MFSWSKRVFGGRKHLSEQLELARYQMARGDIDNALALLRKIRAVEPLNSQACLLEAEILGRVQKHELKAARLIEEYFAARNTPADEVNLKILELYLQISDDLHQHSRVLPLLHRELERPGYSENTREGLQRMLAAVKQPDDGDIVIKSHQVEESKHLRARSNQTVVFSPEELQ